MTDKKDKVRLWGVKLATPEMISKAIKNISKVKKNKPEIKTEEPVKTREFNPEEEYTLEDLDFLKSEEKRIQKLQDDKNNTDERNEELLDIEDQIYDLIELLESTAKFNKSTNNDKTGNGIIARMGGKHFLKKDIVDKFFPIDYENRDYIEPFVGGGSVLFYKKESISETINDIDSIVIDIYKGYKKYGFEEIKKAIDGDYTKEEFNKIKQSKPTTEFSKFIRLLILYKTSFFGNMRTHNRRESINLKQNFHNRLKNVKILNTDYKKVIKDYNTENSFFYLDPPYRGSSLTHYDNFNIDYNELYNLVKSIKGKFLMSLDDSNENRELFKEFNIYNVKTRYANPILGGFKKGKKNELLISNYNTLNQSSVIGGAILEEHKYICKACDISFSDKTKTTRHINTKKHLEKLKSIDITTDADIKKYNDKILTTERKQRKLKPEVDKKPIILKPYYDVGEIPEGYREATEFEALKSGKYGDFGKYKLNEDKFKDYKDLGFLFDSDISDNELDFKIRGITYKLKYFKKEYTRLLNLHGFNKLPKSRQAEITEKAEDIKDKYDRLGVIYNKYFKIYFHRQGKPFTSIKLNINADEKAVITTVDKPVSNYISEPVKPEPRNKSKTVKTNENLPYIFKAEGKQDLELPTKYFVNGKIKSSIAEKLYKLNIRLEKEYYTTEDYNKYFYQKQIIGKNIITDYLFKKYRSYIDRKKSERVVYSTKVQKILKAIGNEPIKSIVIRRSPLKGYITSFINLLTKKNIAERLKTTPYDKLFHLSIIINEKVLLEKNELINMDYKFPSSPDDESKTITRGNRNITINQMLNNARRGLGDYKFFNYDGMFNNCQDFILSLLQFSGIGSKEDYDFIKQHTAEILDNSDYISDNVKSIMNNVTDLAGVIRQAIGGHLKSLYGSVIQSVLFDKKKWTTGKAIEWLIKHQYDGLVVDIKSKYLRYRQISPEIIKRENYQYRTLKLQNGISLVIAYSPLIDVD